MTRVQREGEEEEGVREGNVHGGLKTALRSPVFLNDSVISSVPR